MLSKLSARKFSDWNSYRCGSLVSTIYLSSLQQDTNLVVIESAFSNSHIAIVLFSIVSNIFTLLVLDKLPVPKSPDVAELSSFYDKLRREGEPSRLDDVLVSKFSLRPILVDFFCVDSYDMLMIVDSLGFCYVWQFNSVDSTWIMVYNFSLITSGISDSDCLEQKQIISATLCMESSVLVWHEKSTATHSSGSKSTSSVKYCYLTFGAADTRKGLSDPSAFDIPPSMSHPITVLVLDSIHSFHLYHDGKGCWIVENDGTVFHYDFSLCQMLSTLGCSIRQSGCSRFKAAIFAGSSEVKCSNTLYILGDAGEVSTIICCRHYLKVVNQVLPTDLKKKLIVRASRATNVSPSETINLQDFSVVCEDCSISSGQVKVNAAYFSISTPGHCYLLKHTHLPLAVTPDEMFSTEFWQNTSNGQPTVNYKALTLLDEQMNHCLYRDVSLPSGGGKNKRSPFLGGHSILPVDCLHSKLVLTPLLTPDLNNRILFDGQNVAPDDDSTGYSAVVLLLRSPSSMLQINCQFLVNAKTSQLKSQGLLSLQQHQLWDIIINPGSADHDLPSSSSISWSSANEDAVDASTPLSENQNILNVVMDKAFPVTAAAAVTSDNAEKVDENTDVLGDVPLSFKGNPWGNVRFSEDTAGSAAADRMNKQTWSPSRLVNSRISGSSSGTQRPSVFSLQAMPLSLTGERSNATSVVYGAPEVSDVVISKGDSNNSRPGTSKAAVGSSNAFTFESKPSDMKSEDSSANPSIQYTEYLLQRMAEPEAVTVVTNSDPPTDYNVDALLDQCMKEYEDRLRAINISAVVREKAKQRQNSSNIGSSVAAEAAFRDGLRLVEDQRNQELNRLIEKYLDESVHPAVPTVNDPKKRLRTTDAMLISACYQVHWDDIKSFFDLHQSSVGEDESHLLSDINESPLHWMDCLDLVSLSPANNILHSDYPPDNEINIFHVVDPFKLLEIVNTVNPARRSLYRSEPNAHLIDFTSPCYAVEQMVRQLLFTHPSEMFAVLLHLRRVERELKTRFETRQAARKAREKPAALLTQSPNVSLMDTDDYYSNFYSSVLRDAIIEGTPTAPVTAASRLSLPSNTPPITASASSSSAAVKAALRSAVSNPAESDNEDEGDGGAMSYFKTVGGSGSDSDEEKESQPLGTINEQEEGGEGDEEHESDEEAEHHRLDMPLIPLKQVASDIDVLGTLSELELQQLLNQKEKRIARFSGMHSAMSSAESSPVRSYEQAAVLSRMASAEGAASGITDELLLDAIARDRGSGVFTFPGFEDELEKEEAQLNEDDESDVEQFSFFKEVGSDGDSLLDGTDGEEEEDDWMTAAAAAGAAGDYGDVDEGREYVSLVDRLHTVSAAIVFLNTKPLQNWDILSHYANLTSTQQDCLLKMLLMCGDTTLAVEAMFSWNRLYLLTLYMIRLSASANYVAQHMDMLAHNEQGYFQPNGITRNVNKNEADIFSDAYYHSGRGRLNRPDSFPGHLSPVSPFVRAKTPDWNKVGNGWDIEFEEQVETEARLLSQQQPQSSSGLEKELSFAERRMLEAVQLFKRVFLFCLQRNSLDCAREIVKYKPKWVQDKVIVTLFRLFASSKYSATSPMVRDESTLLKILGKKL